jgi:hypothetical protein
MKRADLLADIASKQAEIDKINIEIESLEQMDPVQSLAIGLHAELCTHNHTDQCGWEYEFKDKVPNWDGHAHKRWLDKAVKLHNYLEVNNIEVEQVFDILALTKRF